MGLTEIDKIHKKLIEFCVIKFCNIISNYFIFKNLLVVSAQTLSLKVDIVFGDFDLIWSLEI